MRRRNSIIPADVVPTATVDAAAAAALPPNFHEWFICRLLRVTGLVGFGQDGALVPGRAKGRGLLLHAMMAFSFYAAPKSAVGEPGGASWGITLGFMLCFSNTLAKAWAMWWGWDPASFCDVFRGLSANELWLCKMVNLAAQHCLSAFLAVCMYGSPFLPYALVPSLAEDAARGGGLRGALPWTLAVYLCCLVFFAFQMAATGSFILVCAVVSLKTRRFANRVAAASDYFLERWDTLHGESWSDTATTADAAGANVEDGAVQTETERLVQNAATTDAQLEHLARKIGHSLIAENTMLHAHADSISRSYAVYFLGAEFLMILCVICFALAVAEGPTAVGYSGAVSSDFHFAWAVFFAVATAQFICIVIGVPLSITYHGIKVCEAFRRRPCDPWNRIDEHLRHELIGFSTLGHKIGPSGFLVLAYSLSSFFIWRWVHAGMGL